MGTQLRRIARTCTSETAGYFCNNNLVSGCRVPVLRRSIPRNVLQTAFVQKCGISSVAAQDSSDIIFTKTDALHPAPIRRYSDLLHKGVLSPDKNQFNAVNRLQELHNRLKNYKPACVTYKPDLLGPDGSPLFEGSQRTDRTDSHVQGDKIDDETLQKAPRGLYIHGGVGSGKTLLLDLFYDSMPTQHKKRVHFNAFMLFLYSEINRWNLCCDVDDEVSDFLTPTESIARKILQDAWLICFDEIQLSDYGTCSLLSAIFQHMINHGAVIVATSNRSPDHLGDSSLTEMHDGEVGEIVTESIASFKRLLQHQCDVFHLDSEIDYRDQAKPGKQTYFYPITKETEERFDTAFANCVGPGEGLKSAQVEVYGREILIPLATTNGVARFTFKELCTTPKGPADYIQICNNYQTVFVEGIPRMNIQMKNEARRLLSFIDAAYESKTKVFCTADASPEELFTLLPKDGSDDSTDTMHMEMIGEIAYDLQLHGLDLRTLGFISGEDEIFSFKRAISRLKEMQGILYQIAAHRPQVFSPYKGSESERKEAEKNRWSREMRRRKKIKELEEAKAAATGDISAAGGEQGISTETDWGDEASYVAWSQDIVRKEEEDRKRREVSERQVNAPQFGEQHFWGFGWWENAIERIKQKAFSNDENDKNK